MAFVRINGVLLHYRLHGPANGPALVLANSLGTDARIWDDFIDLMSGHHRILSYDKRGHGLSDTPEGDYALADHLEDLVGLLDHAGMQKPAVMGVSVGGLIAQGLAIAHPERVTALVLCDTAPRLGEATAWNDRIASVRAYGMEAISQSIMERWFSAGLFRQAPDALAGWRNLFVRTDPDGYCRTCATLRDTDLTAEIGDIACPTLVVCGGEDLSTPPDMVHASTAAIPGARFALIADAGHIPSIEQPQKLAELVTTFLKEAGHG
ncbi:MAG: 3-oxoadipate enol-lactonase [Alphaproteobacteria bacterium]|nr:3-oxoadipate enol-lactonase [Alphaproteobacteria bacterium]